uniref:Cysteine/serine-rich nuclear protein N-terminal domain-containing protein n=1 Tax=Acrobeloides nanus TaxID=290746 RepID=A0A914EJS2_9BILA
LETINEMEEPTEAVSVTPFITTSMDDEPRVENEKKPANKNVDDNSSSSSESEVEDECCEEDEVFHDVNLLQPLSNKNRKLLLKEAGVRINQNEKFECRNIRRSRLTCGCSCEDGICLPETCECAQEDISCQVDRPSFPCSCTASSCENPVGRMEFDSSNVRSHFMQTVKRIKASESANLESPTKCSPRNSLIETERCAPSCFSTPQLTPYLKTLDRWSLHSSIGSRNLKSPGTPNSDIIVEDILAASKPLDQTLEDSPIKSSVFAPCPSLLGPSKTRSKISVLMAARSISFTSSMDRAD